MSQNLRKQLANLKVLCKVKGHKAKKIILKELSNDQCFCKAVHEIVRNTVKGNVKLSEPEKKKLRRHKKLMLDLAKKRKDHRKTKTLVQQKGTGIFLPILIPLVTTLIETLMSET